MTSAIRVSAQKGEGEEGEASEEGEKRTGSAWSRRPGAEAAAAAAGATETQLVPHTEPGGELQRGRG